MKNLINTLIPKFITFEVSLIRLGEITEKMIEEEFGLKLTYKKDFCFTNDEYYEMYVCFDGEKIIGKLQELNYDEDNYLILARFLSTGLNKEFSKIVLNTEDKETVLIEIYYPEYLKAKEKK